MVENKVKIWSLFIIHVTFKNIKGTVKCSLEVNMNFYLLIDNSV